MSDLFTATTAAEVEEALSRGEDIEKEEGWKTPLASACQRGELEVVDCLLDHGANPNHCPLGSVGPIQMAAALGHAVIVKRLIRAGVEINNNQGGRASTALMFASVKGHIDVVDCLLSLGADTGAVSPTGRTALMMASERGMVDVVDRILAAGCNVNAQDNKGFTAMMWAAEGGHVPIIDRLVVHGADFNHQNERGENALLLASKKGHTEAVDRLLSLGCDVNVQNEKGMTAMMWACSRKNIEIGRAHV